MDLYMHIASPPSRIALVIVKHLGLKFNLKITTVLAGDTKTPEFMKMNPNHTVPTLDDNGFILFESRAIITYLINQYRPDSPLYPKHPKQRATVDKLLYLDASGVFPAVLGVVNPKFLQNIEVPEESMNNLNEKISVLTELLGEKKFFLGNQVTLADISVGSTLGIFMDGQVVSIPEPLQQWYQRTLEAIPELAEANGQADEVIAAILADRNQS